MTRLAVLVLVAGLAACSHVREPEPSTARPASGSGRGDEATRPPRAFRSDYVIAVEPDCIDRELRSRSLNRYGDPESTRYSGDAPPDLQAVTAGSFDPEPLDEQTRAEASRMMYVLRRHPDIETTCSAARHDEALRAERKRNDELARRVLRTVVQASPRAKRGDPVLLVFQIENTSTEVARVTTGRRSCRSFVVEQRSPDGSWVQIWESWAYDERRVTPGMVLTCPMVAEVHAIDRDAPYIVERTWPQVATDGAPVAPGVYRARSPAHTSEPELPDPSPAVFEIEG